MFMVSQIEFQVLLLSQNLEYIWDEIVVCMQGQGSLASQVVTLEKLWFLLPFISQHHKRYLQNEFPGICTKR